MIIEDLLKKSVEMGASDLFISVAIPPTVKINNNFVKLSEEKLMPDRTKEIIEPILSDDLKKKLELAGEVDFSYSISGIGRFRADVYKQRGSYAAAIRVFRFDRPNPDALGIPPQVLELSKLNKGLVLVTGPTGSGKSTTLSCLIDRINRERECRIITLEDPIEYMHRHEKSIVEQREVGYDTKSYAHGLRAALRQASNVILIGEMRDFETISTAITAAETGHLVLSTLHTIGAAKTIDRIIDVFPPSQQQQVKMQLSTVLSAVVTQQLVPSPNSGRVAAFEVMFMNTAIRNMIRESKVFQIDSAIQAGRAEGMVNMDYSVALLTKQGKITEETAYQYCVNPEALKRYLSQ